MFSSKFPEMYPDKQTSEEGYGIKRNRDEDIRLTVNNMNQANS